MPFFASAAEVDCYVGGTLRLAAVDPFLGPRLAAASLTIELVCEEPAARFVVELFDPVTVIWDDHALAADVELSCRADVLDRYMRGEQTLVDALASGDVLARGRVSKVLKILPVLEQSFPFYRQLVAVKERAATLSAHT